MAIGPSDENMLGGGPAPRRPGLPATFETNPVRSGPPGQGPAAPITPAATSPRAAGRAGAAPAPPAPATAAPPLGAIAAATGRLMQGLTRPENIAAGVPNPATAPSAMAKGGSLGLIAPGLSARERGQEFAAGVSGVARDIGNTAAGAYNSFAAASDAVLRPVGEFVQGAAGIEPSKPGIRETLIAAQAQRQQKGGPGAGAQVGRVPTATVPTAVVEPAPKPLPPAPAPTPTPPAVDPRMQAAPMNTIIGADGVPRSIAVAPGLQGGPTVASAGVAQAPALPQLQAPPSSIARSDPSRTRAGDEATKRAVQEIESQLFRNSLGSARGERSARALQGQLVQSLAGLAPTLGASADAADARNVQARTALAQTAAQQGAAQLQAQTAAAVNERRSQAAELVAQIGASARPPTLITGDQGAYTIGPNGQAVPVLAPDGAQVRPTGGGGQGVKPDTLFKEFNGRISAIQSDPTLSPEVKQQQIQQLYADPLFQGLAQYLQAGQ